MRHIRTVGFLVAILGTLIFWFKEMNFFKSSLSLRAYIGYFFISLPVLVFYLFPFLSLVIASSAVKRKFPESLVQGATAITACFIPALYWILKLETLFNLFFSYFAFVPLLLSIVAPLFFLGLLWILSLSQKNNKIA